MRSPYLGHLSPRGRTGSRLLLANPGAVFRICGNPLSLPIETPAEARGGCSRTMVPAVAGGASEPRWVAG